MKVLKAQIENLTNILTDCIMFEKATKHSTIIAEYAKPTRKFKARRIAYKKVYDN